MLSGKLERYIFNCKNEAFVQGNRSGMKSGRYTRAYARASVSSPRAELMQIAPPFGVYRPVVARWQDEIGETLLEARTQVRAFLSRQLGLALADRFSDNKSHGTTYIEKQRMSRCNRDRLDFGGLLQSVGEFAARAAELEVPIGGLRWCGYEDTVLAASFAPGTAVGRLLVERGHITRMLRAAGLPHVPIRQPEHVALFRYHVGKNHRNNLARHQRGNILDIVSRNLAAAEIDAVTLDRVIVGDGYDRPFVAEDWLSELPAEQELVTV
jgi:hypothetical protein